MAKAIPSRWVGVWLTAVSIAACEVPSANPDGEPTTPGQARVRAGAAVAQRAPGPQAQPTPLGPDAPLELGTPPEITTEDPGSPLPEAAPPLEAPPDEPATVEEVTPLPGVLSPRIEVVLAPTTALIPGTVADPNPAAIQDQGLNSSVVFKVVSELGVPQANVPVSFTRSDPTSGVQTLSSSTDAQGLVRAWYLAGVAPSQTLTASAAGYLPGSVQLTRATTVPKTVGRYAAAYFNAPPAAYSLYSVSVIPETAPTRTYYSLSSVWRTDSSFALYGGLQMTDCASVASSTNPAIVAVCSSAAGTYRGRMAIFSSWDWTMPSGTVLHPKLVSAPNAQNCTPFDHEGSGLGCVGVIPWGVGEEWRWWLELMPGAEANYQRVRAIVSNAQRSIKITIATIDVPGSLDLQTVGGFNENWGGAPAASCLNVDYRAMKITRMGFWNGTSWVSPTSGWGLGGLYDGTMTRCQNYAFVTGTAAFRIASGGSGVWSKLADTLVTDPSTGRRVFTEDQLLWPWQPINVSTIPKP